MIEQIKQAVANAGLTLKECSSTHWQIIGGIAIVNIHSGKRGFTQYVQGTGAGKPVKSVPALITSATTVAIGQKCAQRKRYGGSKNRKWRQASRTGQPVCQWCKRPFASIEEATIDHVIPLSKGGSNGDDNLVLACATCNTMRSNKVTTKELQRVNEDRKQ